VLLLASQAEARIRRSWIYTELLAAAAAVVIAVPIRVEVLKEVSPLPDIATQLPDGRNRREFYNEAVNTNNVRMEQLPDRAQAGLAGLVRRALFEASAEERADVVIGDALRIPSNIEPIARRSP
jgi:hypothetical protein